MAIDVLIVSDDLVGRRILQKHLDAFGYPSRVVATGEPALKEYFEKPPDVVVMEGSDKYEMARRMKAGLRDDYVPIVMFSASKSEERISEGFEAGADDFIATPYSREMLHVRLEAALRTKALFQKIADNRRELQKLYDRQNSDQQLAERVMASLIRSDLLKSSFIRYRTIPAEIFNGDLLMAESTPNGEVRVMLADFSGHGLAAAIGSQPAASVFRAMTAKGYPVGDVMTVANRTLKDLLPPELFLAVCVVEFEPVSRNLRVWNSGMPEVHIFRPGAGCVAVIPSTNIPLGVMGGLKPSLSAVVELQDGDRVLLQSDGFVEANNEHGEEFGLQRLEHVLNTAPAPQVYQGLIDAHTEFRGAHPMADDMTIVEIEYDHRLRAVTPGIATSPAAFHLSLDFGFAFLKDNEPVHAAQDILDRLPIFQACPDAMVVFLELFNNAVDHGLLGLESSLKDGVDGFERFIAERRERLDALKSGYVRCDLEVRECGRQLVLRVEDSGPGFDFDRGRTMAQDKPYGRGLALVRHLCQELKFFGPGNYVEAVMQVPASDDAGATSETADVVETIADAALAQAADVSTTCAPNAAAESPPPAESSPSTAERQAD